MLYLPMPTVILWQTNLSDLGLENREILYINLEWSYMVYVYMS